MSEPVEAARRQRWARMAPELGAALAHHRAGRLDKAEALYRKILHRVPDHPDAMHMLGAIATSRGRPERAIQLIGKVVEIFPNLAEAHFNLGNAYAAQGKRPQAIACYRRAVGARPDYALAYSSLGREQNEEGDFAGALASCGAALRFDPVLPQGHLNLGIAQWNLGRLAEAETAFREALRLKPDYLPALGYLAQVLIEYSRFADARDCQEQIVLLQPKDALAHRALAVSEFRTGDHENAFARFRHAVALKPDYAEGWTSFGWALRALGRFDEAVECFRRALAIDPDLVEARRMLAATGEGARDRAEAERLRAALAAPELDANARVGAGFALATLLDRTDQYDEAFACFAAANALAREALVAAGRGYDSEAFERRVDRLIDAFTPEFFTAVASGGVASAFPVFIVGMPRSGTTLVEQIVASHSQVFGAGELTEIGRLVQALPPPSADPATVGHWVATAPALAQGYLALLRSLAHDAARVTDKLPDNILNLGPIAALLPASRIILCRRDPRDLCLSSYFQLFAGGNPYSYDLADCVHRYLHVERLVAHWRRVLPHAMLEIRYEDVVANLEGEARRLIDFLGLEWEPACLEFHRTERVVVTQSTWQVRQPLYAGSVGRWRHYRRHIRPLLDAFGD